MLDAAAAWLLCAASLHLTAGKPRFTHHGCLQITAGSLLPLKAPVMRGTVLDVMACRGRLEVRGVGAAGWRDVLNLTLLDPAARPTMC